MVVRVTPSSAARWWALALLLVGGLLGWLVHPLVWVVAGPFRWSALLYMTAAQESGLNPSAVGDVGSVYGDSVGMLQFNTSSWPELTGRPLGDRSSPFLSGYYAARYIQTALLASWSWYQLALPIYGAALMRWAWTHGISAYSIEHSEDAWGAFIQEGKSASAFLVARGLTLLPAVAGMVALWKLAGGLLARRRSRA